ncbi:MAG: XdhC family protein [Oscillibacter sp.]|nr:XdhC family protein [Oscillibacter sp.]
MASRREFQNILDRVRSGGTAERVLTAEGIEGAEGETWVRRFRPRERLLLFGCGYIAQALCPLAADLDFAVSAADDRPAFADAARFPRAERVLCAGYGEAAETFAIGPGDYIAVLTRGHLFDADCLRAILQGTFPRYVGVIGSQGRAAALLDQLASEGFSRALLDRIHTPIGLDIHALTVPEIAVSIAAELIAVRRADLDRRSKSAILTDEGFCEPVLEFLAGSDVSGETGSTDNGGTGREFVPRAVLTVCATGGSTPVKSGGMMAVDAQGNVAGTIGGGSGEGQLIQMAREALGEPLGAWQGKRLVTVAMHSGPTEEGMACGGSMRVLMEIVKA